MPDEEDTPSSGGREEEPKRAKEVPLDGEGGKKPTVGEETPIRDMTVVVGTTVTTSGKVKVLGGQEKEDWLKNNGYFGVRDSDAYLLDDVEALLLHERKRLVVFPEEGVPGELRDPGNPIPPEGALPAEGSLDFSELISFFARFDPEIWVKYAVFRDLRSRGYIVRGGFGKGIDYRVYGRGAKAGSSEARYLVSVVVEGKPLELETLDAITRYAISSRKKLVLAVVDRLGEPTFYQVDQYKLDSKSGAGLGWLTGASGRDGKVDNAGDVVDLEGSGDA
ncbi:MAG: tRNA-intron lyase [Promethearchaeota archaeon]